MRTPTVVATLILLSIAGIFTFAYLFYISELAPIIALTARDGGDNITGNDPNTSLSSTDILRLAPTKIKQLYGCDLLDDSLCVPITNRFESYYASANSTEIYSIASSEVSLLEGKIGRGLSIKALERSPVEIRNADILNPTRFSISFWIKVTDDMDKYGVVLSHQDRAGTSGWFIDMISQAESNPTLRFNVLNSSSHVFSTREMMIDRNAFVHIVAAFDGSTVSIYKDATLYDSLEFIGPYLPDPNLSIKIGSQAYCASCNRWTGTIDDLRIYNKYLTPSEISGIVFRDSSQANNTVNGAADALELSPDERLVGYWPFDENLNDVSGWDNHGSVATLLGSIAFSPDGRLFFTEKNTGNIRVIDTESNLRDEPFVSIENVYASWEQGLLGIAIDPNFEENHYIYTYYTALDNQTGEIFNRIIRLTEKDNFSIDSEVILDRIPASDGYHAGGALAFGSDGKLYATVGDATQGTFAQEPRILTGKVLRINSDGSVPEDNPFPNSPVFAIGIRNSYGIALDKNSNYGIITENGATSYDEINIVYKGGNYGYPTLQPPNTPGQLSNSTSDVKPIRTYRDTIAPTQAIYYDGDEFPELRGKFLFGTYTGDIYALGLDENGDVVEEIKIDLKSYPFTPVISIAQSPDGEIYYGGYELKRLESLNMANTSSMEIIEIEYNGTVFPLVTDISVDNSQSEISLELSINNTILSKNSTGSYVGIRGTPVSEINVQFPERLLEGIARISLITGERQILSQEPERWRVTFSVSEDLRECEVFPPQNHDSGQERHLPRCLYLNIQ